MGYDVTIGPLVTDETLEFSDRVIEREHIYFTYNHSSIFEKLGVYPRNFNGKTVGEIIPVYVNAVKQLEKEMSDCGVPISDDCANVSGKYMCSDLYAEDEEVVLRILKGVLQVLTRCNMSYVWYSD